LTAGQDQTAAAGEPAAKTGAKAGMKAGTTSGEGSSQMFRSPVAVAIWWLWVLFAAGNVIDLAVQGRDHLSVVAGFILLLVTGVVYITARRPRIVVTDDTLAIVNPLRDHRIGWAAVAGADVGDLVRVRCEWPPDSRRVIYAWAVHSSRRKQASAKMRESRRARRGAGVGGFGVFGALPEPVAAARPSAVSEADQVVAVLTARAEQVRAAVSGPAATAPVSYWSWLALAAVAVPALALLVAVLA
jgi:hypothetical protein